MKLESTRWLFEAQVWDQVCDQVWHKVYSQVWDKSGNQVGLKVGAQVKWNMNIRLYNETRKY